MYFLGVDQSLREPGVAVVDTHGKVIVAGCTRVGVSLSGGRRLAAIEAFLQEQAGALPVVAAALEGPSLNSTHREFDLGEVSGVVRAWIYRSWEIEPLVVAPLQLKRFATGQGGADKAAVINAVNKHWQHVTDNDNVADAVVLAQIARTAHTKEGFVTRAQADVTVALSRPRASVKRRRRKEGENI